MYRSALVPPLLAAAVLLTACGGDDDADATSDDRSTTSAASSAPATDEPTGTAGDGGAEEAADEDTPASGGGSGGSGGAPAPQSTSRPAPGTPDAPAPGTTPDGDRLHDPDGAGPLPAEVLVSQGSVVWAVYLDTGSPVDEWQAASLGETESYLTGLYGYTGSGIGSVSCDAGAAEQLGFVPDDNRLAVYFATAEDATTFVAIYDRQDVGSAEVTTYCLD
ncbi:hypothetical protein [Blastococcus sp. SYSU D00813]